MQTHEHKEFNVLEACLKVVVITTAEYFIIQVRNKLIDQNLRIWVVHLSFVFLNKGLNFIFELIVCFEKVVWNFDTQFKSLC